MSDTNKSVVHVSSGGGALSIIAIIIAIVAILKGESLQNSGDIMQLIYMVCLIYASLNMIFLMLLPAFCIGFVIAIPGIVSEKEETLAVMIVFGAIAGIASYGYLITWWFSLLPFEYLL